MTPIQIPLRHPRSRSPIPPHSEHSHFPLQNQRIQSSLPVQAHDPITRENSSIERGDDRDGSYPRKGDPRGRGWLELDGWISSLVSILRCAFACAFMRDQGFSQLKNVNDSIVESSHGDVE